MDGVLGAASVIIGSSALAAAAFFAPTNAFVLTLAMLPYVCGFIWAQTPYVGELMALMPDIKGIAASILTSVRLLLAAATVWLANHWYNGTIYPLTITIVGVVAVIITTIVLYERDGRRASRS